MGLFNEYGWRRIQLRTGANLGLNYYREGEKVDIPDGVYIGSAEKGIIVVSDGILVNTFSQLIDTEGNIIPLESLRTGELPQPTAILISLERYEILKGKEYLDEENKQTITKNNAGDRN